MFLLDFPVGEQGKETPAPRISPETKRNLMPMVVDSACSSGPVQEDSVQRQLQLDVIADLHSAVEELERALDDLRDLSEQPGYEFVDRIFPGYIWAVEQIQELNSSLILQAPSKPDPSE